jgi:hypothetical protein
MPFLSRLLGDFDGATPKLHAIGVKAAENGLADVLAVRDMLELSGSGNGRTRATRSFHAQVFGKASPTIVNHRLICLVHLRTSKVVAQS